MSIENHCIFLENGKLASTSRQDLTRMFDQFKGHPNNNTLVVYFHGGLVSNKAARKTAEILLPKFKQAGGYPFFFIWESSLIETVANNFSEILQKNLSDIFDENIFQQIQTRVTQFVLAKLGIEEGERGGILELESEFDVRDRLAALQPGEDLFDERELGQIEGLDEVSAVQKQQFKTVLEEDGIIDRESRKIANSLRSEDQVRQDFEESRGSRVQGSTTTLMSPEILAEIKAGATTPAARGDISTATIIKFAVDIFIKVIARLVRKRGHGIYPTIVEEILRKFYLANVGKVLWDLMKKDTLDSFGRDDKIFGGTAFLEELRSLWEEGHRPRILLVGHSAGSIYISHFLKFADQNLPEEIKFDVVFLAPAVAVDLFAQTIDDHGRRINRIRQFTMQDIFEKRDHLVPVIPIYPYSLLYFVSGILEDEADKPMAGMQRFYKDAPPFQTGAFPQLDRVREFLTHPPERTIWSEADLGPGCASFATKHVDFDDLDEATLQSVQHIIRAGF